MKAQSESARRGSEKVFGCGRNSFWESRAFATVWRKKKDQRTASRGAQTAKSSLEMCAYFLLFCLSKKGEELAEWRLASDKKKKTEIPQLRHQLSVDCSIVHRADGEK